MESKYLMFGGAAVLAYLWYKNQQDAAPTPQTTPVVPTSPTSGTTAPAPHAQTLQAIQNVINNSGVSSTYIYSQQSPDIWNYYAMQAIPGWTAPTPESMFGTYGNAHAPITFQAWWQKVQQFLPQGLSGGNIPRVNQQMAMGWLQ